MTKAEELKLLAQIEDLIHFAGADSYIAMTFKGMCEVCRENIVQDFGNIPVQDAEDYREARDAEIRDHDNTKKLLAQAQELWKQSMDEVDALRKRIKEVEEERDVMTECHDGLAEMIDKYETEIMRLKAEVYNLRKWGESPVVPEGV